MKLDLTDVTFIIPVRIDSVVRLENLLLTIRNLESNFVTHIEIIEASRYNNGLIKSLISKNICYRFIEDKDPIFHRTKYINIACSKIETSIMGVWDADVIFWPEQIIEAVENIRLEQCDVAYPYDGSFWDTSDILRNYYYTNRNINFLLENTSKMKLLYSSHRGAVGGAFLASTKKYQEGGMENEDFYGWGPEDGERYSRWKGLNFRIFRSQGCLLHLSHPRDINGGVEVPTFGIMKKREALRVIMNSTKEELKEYIEKMKYSRGLPPL